jgi:GMP synthase (glutamine-hydrolysing)
MLPIYVVNNYGQFNHLIHRALRDTGIGVEMISNTTQPEKVRNGCRGLILGGGPTMDRAGRCPEYLDLGLPVLGICLGLHIIATARGGRVTKGASGGYGDVSVEILDNDVILAGYPQNIHVWASHADEVSTVPPGFDILAKSTICNTEAMKSRSEPLFGIQWHPEVSHTVNGRQVFLNFDGLCRK